MEEQLIPFTLIRKNIRSIRLTVVPPDGAVRISAPFGIDERVIVDFVRQKNAWILKARERIAKLPPPNTDYQEGDEIFLFGHGYPLSILQSQNKNEIQLKESRLIMSIHSNDTPAIRAGLLKAFERESLRVKIVELLPKWEAITSLKANEWHIKDMKTRWGSCNVRDKRVWLSLRLAAQPIFCIEYVILHELIHLIEPRHNARFYDLLKKYMPAYRDAEAILNHRA